MTNIRSGITPVLPDHRNLSFPRTFGSVSPETLPDEYSCEAGFSVPDQNADGLPFGCSGYSQSELCQDEDGVRYSPEYTYRKGQLLDGTLGQEVGVTLKKSLKSLVVYGALPGDVLFTDATDTALDQVAGPQRRGRYFEVEDKTELDSFDDVRSALWLNRQAKRPVSVGTPWFIEWGVPNPGGLNGILPDFYYNGNPNNYPWHNFKVSGWKQINGQSYLVGKPWQGPNYGDKGYVYFSREVFNKVMKIRETGAFTVARATPADLQRVTLSILETIVSYLRLILSRLVT